MCNCSVSSNCSVSNGRIVSNVSSGVSDISIVSNVHIVGNVSIVRILSSVKKKDQFQSFNEGLKKEEYTLFYQIVRTRSLSSSKRKFPVP